MGVPTWKQFKTYSGPTIIGTAVIPPPTKSTSIQRWHWITTKVETGATYGTVVMFDGTGVTAGPDQFILVYPAELAAEDFNAADDQGLLGKLTARLLAVKDPSIAPKIDAMQKAFAAEGWYLSPIGEFRFSGARGVTVGRKVVQVKQGDLVFGDVLRDTVTPVDGKVPRSGPQWQQSAKWCQLFADLFADKAGWAVQDAFGAERLVKAFKSPRLKTPSGLTLSIEAAIFNGADVGSLRAHEIGEALDLAMAVWYSNSVNAPAIALQCVSRVLGQGGVDDHFPARLLRSLGTSTYGRWNATDPNGRYQRTRRLALASGLWPRSLFEGQSAIMPAQL